MSTASTAVLAATPESSLWDHHLAPFLERYSLVLGIAFVAIACIRIASTYNALSLTIDEPVHLAAGVEYLANHTYTVDIEHPPLSRAVEALGPYLAGARPIHLSSTHAQGRAILARSGNYDRTIFLMRSGNLAFFLFACTVVFCWSSYAFGKAVAVVATALFTWLPPILADAGLATTDLALGATAAAAFFTAVLWAEKPKWTRALLFGFCGALALLSKTTAIGYVPFSLTLALGCYLLVARPGWRALRQLAGERIATFCLAAITTALLVWAGYWFSFGPVPRIGMSLPAPEYFNGIIYVLAHNKLGHGAFLLGEYRMTGWWYYFPVALLVKTPIPFLILLAVGIAVCLRHRRQLPYLLPLAFSLGIMLPAMASRIDIGIRHIEPIYVGLSIIAALGLMQLLQVRRWWPASAAAVLGLVTWLAVSVAGQHPDYLAYFNAFAGKHPENVLVDSNYDWGQDLKFLAQHLRQKGVQQIALASLDGAGEPVYLQSWYGLPTVSDVSDSQPSPGWNVISATFDRSYRLQLDGVQVGSKAWYDRVSPTERFGPYFLYYIPEAGKSPSAPAGAAEGR
jgi:hypothetical protein